MTNAVRPSRNHPKRYLVLLDKNRVSDSIQAIRQCAQMGENMRIANTGDVQGGFLQQEQIEQSDLVILDRLGVALVTNPLAKQQGGSLIGASQDREIPIVGVVEESIWNAYEISQEYLKGYKDGVNQLLDKLLVPSEQKEEITALAQSSATWGLQATRVLQSPYSGRGIRVAVLDTGMDLDHPDFVGRTIVSKSFIRGVATAQDGNGHGTHCIGTSCGPRNPKILPRYGIAYEAAIYAGKVLSDEGSGSSFDIVKGIEWAIVNDCAVISLSLGSEVLPGENYEPFYESVGARALDEGTLIIAAAGNESQRPRIIRPVGSPANCPSFMAVAAIDSRMRIAGFSNGGINSRGGAVDIAGPGVDVYSSAPDPAVPQWPARYHTISGTSMATPHVAGIAALYAQSTGQRGQALWNLLTRNTSRLSLSNRDVGSGLVQAPIQ